jgi:ATP-dependent protease ClpP protease subunit
MPFVKGSEKLQEERINSFTKTTKPPNTILFFFSLINFVYFYIMILFLTGEVTKTSTKAFLNSIQDEELEVHIDSVGGDLFEGLKIYNALLNHPKEVSIIVDGLAGSVSSVIALASDNRSIAKTGSFMIHHALVPEASGNHLELKKISNTLEQYSNIIAGVYAERTKLSHDEALELMNDEQTFTAEDSVKLGFSNEIIEPLKAVAKINKIDMNLLETIKAKLTNEAPEIVAEEVTETTTEETPAETTEAPAEGLTPEVEEQIRVIIAEMIAEALAGNTEEVGATIATVLNSITSKGNVDSGAGINETEAVAPVDGISAFYSKMKEIKNKQTKN